MKHPFLKNFPQRFAPGDMVEIHQELRQMKFDISAACYLNNEFKRGSLSGDAVMTVLHIMTQEQSKKAFWALQDLYDPVSPILGPQEYYVLCMHSTGMYAINRRSLQLVSRPKPAETVQIHLEK